MSIRIGHLRAFLAVIDRGSVSEASRWLLRAQSAVTRAVHELEEELHVDLFERRTRGMLPTEFGMALARRARFVEDELASARRDLVEKIGPSFRGRSAPVFTMQVSEQRLQAFAGLTESHHMPSVATRLGIGQAAVSASIRHLESTTGLRLFDRTAKGMIPTTAGDVLALRVRRALSELRIAAAEMEALRGGSVGSVTIGASPLGRALVLPRALARLLPAHPGLHVATTEAPYDALAAGLRAGDIDFLFGALRLTNRAPDLSYEPLFTDELAVVARVAHPLRSKRRTTLADIARERWVLAHRGNPTRDLIDSMFVAQGLAPPAIVVETTDVVVVRGLVQDSDVITAISPQQFDVELRSGLLATLGLRLPATSRVIGITRRSDGHPSPAATLLMEEMRSVCNAFQ